MKKQLTPMQQLQALHLEHLKRKHPTFPVHSLPKKNFGQKTANEITAAINSFLTFNGHYVVRVQTQGQYRPGVGWTRGTTKKGTADLHSVVNGRHVSIEVKGPTDKIRPEQLKTKAEVEHAGGIYLTATSFDMFFNWYQEFTKWGKAS